MSAIQKNFSGIQALKAHFQHNTKGGLVINYLNCKKYDGMVLAIMIVFDTQKERYDLDLQWMSLGLDLYGDTLQESYVYEFKTLENLLAYLLKKYNINVSDIPVKFSFDNNKHPNPLKDKSKKPLFEAGWKQFQGDFKNDIFLDPSLKLIFFTDDF